jgi:predicted metalloprotease
MRLRGVGNSKNIEDRRRSGGGRKSSMGIGAVLVVLALGYFTGIDVTPLLSGQTAPATQSQPVSAADERSAKLHK